MAYGLVFSARTSRRGAQRDRHRSALCTNFLLQRFVHSLAVCLKNSLMITSLTLDGILLTPKYLKILADGLANNRNLQSLSLARCRIGDIGCDLLLEGSQHNPSLRSLNLSSCHLTNRSAAYLSLFLKRRKVDLLQKISKESTSSQDGISTIVEEGLQVLILDRNSKFGDVGLRQLTRILKSDFWLKTLCLQCCGITEGGGKLVLELLQTNGVITQINLRENEVSADTLQTIRKILKMKKNKSEMILMKKRLLSHKRVFAGDTLSKNTSQLTLKKKRFPKNQTYLQLKDDRTVQIQSSTYIWKTRRKNSEICKSHNTTRRNHIKSTNVDKLRNCLSFMIESNQNLMTILENSTDFLVKEKNRRLSAEEAYYKIQPRLRNLRNKIAMQNSIHSNMLYENQVYLNLQNVFNKLGIFTKKKELNVNSKNLKAEVD